MAQTSTAAESAESALTVLRAMVTIADATLAKVTELTLTQFRAIRAVVERTPVTMSAVAQELAVNPSSVTRACDRLIALGLMERAQNPFNKREILLAPSAAGRRVVDRVNEDRRAVLSAILDRVEPGERQAITDAFAAFSAAATGLLEPFAHPVRR